MRLALSEIGVTTLAGSEETLAAYRGRVLLIVNVASQCGFTKQYAGLEALYRRHRAEGFAVLGFPCNQFGGQEPGDAAAIRAFCSLRYDVSFPLFAKVKVRGSEAHPLFQQLTAARRGFLFSRAIKWNFTKFLVARDGQIVRRFAPPTAPEKIERYLLAELEQASPHAGATGEPPAP
ncbi:MAG TPA: glutathione peroxidase [Pirellulales bacterium]|jgi:glutathione peroxidase|nr:glutathione peroxidase [Pirellulales bacterium]